MRKILIIGIGAGNPDHVTIQAVDALNAAHVLFIPSKGAEKEDLRQLRHEICTRFIAHDRYRLVGFDVPVRAPARDDYHGVVADWHERTADLYAGLLQRELGEDEVGAFLVWGDPSLYDSTLRTIEAVKAREAFPMDYEVIPGITSVQALASRHRIPLNRIGEPIQVTTGRRIAEAYPDNTDDVVVMLDGGQAFARLPGDEFDIYWGAYLGMADEILIAGRLAEVKDEITQARARARRGKGWIMDTYLLRRRRGG